jgi:hypothetical protein
LGGNKNGEIGKNYEKSSFAAPIKAGLLCGFLAGLINVLFLISENCGLPIFIALYLSQFGTNSAKAGERSEFAMLCKE